MSIGPRGHHLIGDEYSNHPFIREGNPDKKQRRKDSSQPIFGERKVWTTEYNCSMVMQSSSGSCIIVKIISSFTFSTLVYEDFTSINLENKLGEKIGLNLSLVNEKYGQQNTITIEMEQMSCSSQMISLQLHYKSLPSDQLPRELAKRLYKNCS